MRRPVLRGRLKNPEELLHTTELAATKQIFSASRVAEAEEAAVCEIIACGQGEHL